MSFGYGKTILFGEHFVVYGIPAIAGAVDKKTFAEAKESTSLKITEPRVNRSQKGILKIVRGIISSMGISDKVELVVESEIPIGAGMGSSAAFCVATTRALAKFNGLNLSDEEICNYAYEGEKIAHGTPSGIDNTVATFGGLVWFVKNLEGEKNTIEKLKIKEPLEIVIGNTKIEGNTKQLVAGVHERKEENPGKFGVLFEKEMNLVEKARGALQEFDVEKIGELMNDNQELLEEIGVSHPTLEKLIQTARTAGALGAKLTGAGGGGCMIALCPGKQEEVAKAIRDLGFDAYKTKIGV